MTVKLLTEHLLEVRSLTGGCTGSSESTLFKIPQCWKSQIPYFRRSMLDSNMEAFQARLSDLGEQVAKNSIQMTQMMQMVQSMMTQQRVRPSQLEIRDMTSVSDAENK